MNWIRNLKAVIILAIVAAVICVFGMDEIRKGSALNEIVSSETEDAGRYFIECGIRQDELKNKCGEAILDLEELLHRANYEEIIKKLAWEQIGKNGYTIDEKIFTEAMRKIVDGETGSTLYVKNVGNELTSHGILVDVQSMKMIAESCEVAYDNVNANEFTFTLYWNEDNNYGFLPFPEPLMSRYADTYGFKKQDASK